MDAASVAKMELANGAVEDTAMIQIEKISAELTSLGTSWSPAIPWVQGQPYDWGWGGHPMMWGAWGFGMMIMMILFWVLLIVAVVMGIRWLVGQGKSTRSDPAMEILRQRYARGEINKEEFDARRKDLL